VADLRPAGPSRASAESGREARRSANTRLVLSRGTSPPGASRATISALQSLMVAHTRRICLRHDSGVDKPGLRGRWQAGDNVEYLTQSASARSPTRRHHQLASLSGDPASSCRWCAQGDKSRGMVTLDISQDGGVSDVATTASYEHRLHRPSRAQGYARMSWSRTGRPFGPGRGDQRQCRRQQCRHSPI